MNRGSGRRRARITVAVLAIGMIALGFMAAPAIDAIDREVAAWLHAHANPALKRAMQAVSAAHAPRAILAMTMILALVALWRRDIAALATVLITVLGGATLNHLLKHSIQRPRPNFGNALSGATDFSFPSGHVANATLVYGVAAALIVARLPTRRARLAVTLGAGLLVALVGFSRIVLGAHYPSDVLAGAVVALAWLALCLAVAKRWRAKQARAPGPG